MTTEAVCWCLHERRDHSGPEGECMYAFPTMNLAHAPQHWRRCTCPYFEAKT